MIHILAMLYLDTRALFERSLATLSAEKATAVWKKFMDYENKYGDLASAQNVEKRLHEAHPESKPLTCIKRYIRCIRYLRYSTSFVVGNDRHPIGYILESI